MIKTVDKEASSMWNTKVMFPKANYIIRCTDEENGPNSNENPMTTLDWEIVNCEPKTIGDQKYEFDGISFKSYHVTRVNPGGKDDLTEEEADKKSKNSFAQFEKRVLVPCGVISAGDPWDDENPPSVKGKVVHATLYGKKNTSFDSPTPEQLAKGQKTGSVTKDPITGKDSVVYQIQIDTIYGIADVTVRPF